MGTVRQTVAKVLRRLRRGRSRAAPVDHTSTFEARELSPDPPSASPVTDLLYERLTAADVAAVEARLGPDELALWETAEPLYRKHLALAFAAHHGVESALGRSGLSAAMPGPDVHAMAHGPTAAGGSAYYADLVADSLAATGLEFGSGVTALDFGCSSARVVRVLAAAYPDVEWHGCDPIPEAIEWARANIHHVRFERSPERPPLAYPDTTSTRSSPFRSGATSRSRPPSTGLPRCAASSGPAGACS